MKTSTHDNFHCEAWINGEWQIVTAEHARNYSRRIIRCLECKGVVRIHRAGPNNKPRAHAEHSNKFEGCSLGYYFDGNQRLNPENSIT